MRNATLTAGLAVLALRWTKVAAALLLGLTASVAQAQDLPQSISPLKVESDGNGVNIATGKMMPDALTLSVPAAPRLKFDRVQNAAPYVTGELIGNLDSGDQTAVWTVHTVEGVSESFRCGWSLGDKDCQSVTRSGSMLAYGGGKFRHGGSGEVYQLNVIHLLQNPAPSDPNQQKKRLFYASRIEYPDGEVISYTYGTATLPGDPYSRNFYRPIRIDSNLGYYITITYNETDLTQPNWGAPDEVAIYNRNAPGTPLAKLTNSGSNTLTDLAGRMYQGYNLGTLGVNIEIAEFSRTLPTESSAAVTVTAATGLPASAKMIGTVNHDGVTWNYAYTSPHYYLGIDGYTYSGMMVTGPNSFSRSYQFIDPGTHSTLGDTNLVTQVTNELSQTTGYTYDIYQRLTKITYPEGNSVSIGWDDAGNIVSKTSTAKPGSGLADIVEQSHVDLSAYYSSDGSVIECLNVVLCYRPNWTRDALGHQTDYVYNSLGQITEQTDPADAAGVRRKTYVEYEAYDTGRGVISRKKVVRICGDTTTCGTTAELRTEYEYRDGTYLPAIERQVDAATGRIREIQYIYDLAGRVLSMDGPRPGSDDTQYFRYDVLGRKTWEIGAVASNGLRLAKHFTYRDADDKVISVETGTLPDAISTTLTQIDRTDMTYDSRRNAIREVATAGVQTLRVTDRSYLDRGMVDCTAIRMNMSSIPAAGSTAACTKGTTGSFGADRITKTLYDAAGRVQLVQQGYGTALVRNQVSYTYTPNGQRATITDADGNKAQFIYDGHDRQTYWYFPSKTIAGSINTGDYEQYGYDANGNRTSLRRRDGRVLTYTYDNLNRVVTKIVPDGCAPIQVGACAPASATRDVYYSYDIMGRQLTAKFDSAVGADGFTSTYDAFGDFQTNTISMAGFSKTLTYDYDETGNRTRLTHPDGQSFVYTYDALGRLSGLYEGFAAPVQLEAFSYNNQGQLSGRTEGMGSTVAYAYDAAQRLSSQTDSFVGGAGNVVNGSIAYNPASQVVGNSRDNDAYAWRDAVMVNRNYAVNGLNQYTTAGPASFTYDADGNLAADGANTFVYDAENRMISASNGAVLTYDPMGRLWQLAQGTASTRFLYDADALVAEYDGTGAMTARYVHGSNAVADDPLVWYAGGTTRWLHADLQGSIVAASNSAGGSPSINTYDEYGIPGATNVGRFQYTGQAWLGELGMYYYKARIYSPTLGRFMQTDPIGYKDQYNLYAYVQDDPVNGVDPTGLEGNTCSRLGGSSCSGSYAANSTAADSTTRNPKNAIKAQLEVRRVYMGVSDGNAGTKASSGSGHTWIVMVDVKGKSTTYGLWPDGEAGPGTFNGEGNDIRINGHWDINRPPDAARFADVPASRREAVWNIAHQNVTYDTFYNNCTHFALKVWGAATGKSVALPSILPPTPHWLFNKMSGVQ